MKTAIIAGALCLASTTSAFSPGLQSRPRTRTTRAELWPFRRTPQEDPPKVDVASRTASVAGIEVPALPAPPDGDSAWRVTILMSDTGGGHRASANSLRDAFDAMYGSRVECDIVDVFTDFCPWPYSEFVPGYRWLAANPELWGALWEFTALEPIRKLTELAWELQLTDGFKKCLVESRARNDLVISVHPLTQYMPLKVLAEASSAEAPAPPFVTVVTDLGSAHPTWFDAGAEKCFVPSEPLKALAYKYGLDGGQIREYGLPVREGFWKATKADAAATKAARLELGLKPGAPTVLVVGGGDGVGGVPAITVALGEALGAAKASGGGERQIVAVCGKNQAAADELRATEWPEGVSVVVNGFVDNMDRWMAASDCIVTKAGPGTIAEAAIIGLPTLLSTFLPGQEAGNVPYVQDNGFGDLQTTPDEIAATVSDWLDSPVRLAAMADAARKAGRPSATIRIAADCAELMAEAAQAAA